MNAFPGLSAEHALRLANERQAEHRSEAQRSSLRHARRPAEAVGRIAAVAASMRASLHVIGPEFEPQLPTISKLPYRG